MMVAFNDRGSCGDAQPYYYDFLLDPDDPNIPVSTASHISKCLYCQQQIGRLQGVLQDAEAGAVASRADDQAATIDLLRLHFEYLDEYVTCGQVKPFLAALAMPSPQIRIPTPITVHLDHCRQCSEDLQTLKDLSLDTEQLARLSRLFGETPDADSVACARAEPSIPVLGSGSMVGIGADVLEHLCVCPDCRRRVYEWRQAVLEQWQSEPSGRAACPGEEVSAAAVFDWVVPYGRTGSELPSLPAGETCLRQARLEKTQALHEALYGIAERADSGTVTVCSTQGEEDRVGAGADDRYAAYGIDVRVIQRVPEPAGQPAVQRRPAVRSALKPFVKVAAAVTLVPLVVVLLVYTGQASGTGPDDVVGAFARASNVHVRLFRPDRPEPIQELWISRRPGLFMMTAGSGDTLYDMKSRQKRQRDSATAAAQAVALHEREYEGARRIMEGCLGLTLAGTPLDRQWQPIGHDDVNAVDVYALTWTGETSSGRTYLVRWQVTVESRTELPTQTRLYHKYADESGWELQSRRLFEYPTEDEIRSAVAERFPVEAAAPI